MKLNTLQSELENALQGEKYKLYADVLNSHLHEIKIGQSIACLLNYNNGEDISIPLDTLCLLHKTCKNTILYMQNQ